MIKIIKTCLLLVIVACADLFAAQTEVMILGTPHLAQVAAPIPNSQLEPLVQRIASFQPNAVAVEQLRPVDIDSMQKDEFLRTQVIPQFVGNQWLELGSQMQRKLGISRAKAEVQLVNKTGISKINLAVAALDKPTALLGYSMLNEDERKQLPSELNEYLMTGLSNQNEIVKIAIPLSNKLGLSRIYSIDDHFDKQLFQHIAAALMEELQSSDSAAKLMQSDYVQKPIRLMGKASETGDWWPVYSWMNSQAYMDQVMNEEWALFRSGEFSPELAKARLAQWDIRNLNMVSHIMKVVNDNPGKRVLVIVGANHKRFLEQLLRNMMDVTVVPFEDLTKA